jgi:hypothetical protein
LLLTLLRAFFGFWRPLVTESPRNVLFVKLAEQGSTVLAYPAIRAAERRVGRENVYFLVFDENRFILDAMGVIPAENIFERARPFDARSALFYCSTRNGSGTKV